MTAKHGLVSLLVVMLGLAAPVRADTIIQHQSFFAGGVYSGPATARVMQGQMFVEALIPQRVTHPYPLVLVHGGAQTAMNWMTTPDGRKGWAQWFAEEGWKVYMVDVPARGRSAWQPDMNGKLAVVSASRIERNFTAPQDFNDYPQAKLHSQWPGTGRVGDPAFDQFYASQVPSLGRSEGETLTLAASLALLDRIGPAILVVHSQGALNAWTIADARPERIKGMVVIEPNGPPFKDAGTAPDSVERPYGLTTTPLTFEPPATAQLPLTFERQAQPDAPDLIACWLPKGGPRRMPRLAGIPVLLATGEGSYHSQYDHCTSRFLADAGVAHDFIRLGDQGIHGNGHMMMLEKNNLEIAAFLNKWMTQRIR